jgi:hypothetical protein
MSDPIDTNTMRSLIETANDISEASASSKIITLPNQMGTIKVVKSTTARGEPEWTFEYQGFKGAITQGYSRMGGSGYSVVKVTDADGKETRGFHGTHKTISAAVLDAVSMAKHRKNKK